MADRPTASMFRAGRPRTRSRSVHLPSCIPVACKAVKPRTKSAQRAPEKGEGKGRGAGKGKKTIKKSDKAAAAVLSSDSEDLEVDFPHHHPKQPHELPAELPEDADPPQEPGNPNPLQVQPPTPMANNQLNWSHFRPEFSGKLEEDVEAHLLRMEDWMITHDFLKIKRYEGFV